MKKEVLVAVLIGLSMGLVITYGIYRVQNSLSQPPITDVADVLELTNGELESAAVATVLSVHTPQAGAIQTGNTTTVTGTTIPNANVVIFVNEDDQIMVSDNSGNFTFNANLKNGTNVLNIYVVNDSGETAKEERIVVVTDMYEQQNSASETGETSPDN